MRHALIKGIALGVGVLAAAAWAVEISLPARVRAKATFVVNDLGQILFGDTPGKVEVTNLPTTQMVEVTNFPIQEASAEVFNVTLDFSTAAAGPQVIATVPQNRMLVLTDIDGWTLNNSDGVCRFTITSGGSGSGAGPCQLRDSTGTRTVLADGPGVSFSSANGNFTHGIPRRAFTTGLRFGPGETVLLDTYNYLGAGVSIDAQVRGLWVFMGRLVPVS